MTQTTVSISAHASASAEQRYEEVRNLTEALAEPLSPEDQTVQSMPDTSPTKWHRGHTTWFFETFLLEGRLSGYRPFHPMFAFLFNSYYETVGPRHPRPERGLLSRPGTAELGVYRQFVDDAMQRLIAGGLDGTARELLELGLHHEQQHQELLLMDIKHALWRNPMQPAYSVGAPISPPDNSIAPLGWVEHEGGVVEVGHDGSGFAFDNECPRHQVLLQPFALADRTVTCGEWLEFIADGGYCRPELWLSDGWAHVQHSGLTAPLYWAHESDDWSIFTLHGRRSLDPNEPVCHVTYLEADAFARWRGVRLPTEFEWEAVATSMPVAGHFLDPQVLHPRQSLGEVRGKGLFGDVWEWTSSAYLPYPGFHPGTGAVGEYNGKFMNAQQVLRGGCCVTPMHHMRPTYRNFFPAAAAWPFTGVRLAADR